MDIATFMLGMLLRFWTICIPNNLREALRIAILCLVGGILLWLIRASHGNLLGIISAVIFACGAYAILFRRRKRLMPYFNELHIIIWNILLLYTANLVDALSGYRLILFAITFITSIYVLLPLRPSEALRAVLYYYVCSVILAIHILLISYSQPIFHSLLRSEVVGFDDIFIAGLDACGFLTAIVLVVRVDLQSKNDNYKMRVRRFREYTIMSKRFFITQFNPLFLISMSIILAGLLWANNQYHWLPTPFMLTLAVVGCNLLASVPLQESEATKG